MLCWKRMADELIQNGCVDGLGAGNKEQRPAHADSDEQTIQTQNKMEEENKGQQGERDTANPSSDSQCSLNGATPAQDSPRKALNLQSRSRMEGCCSIEK